MTLEHLMALTVTDDHAVQERVWAQTGSGWHPNSIGRRLTEANAVVTDKRVRFIGLDGYEAAGGTVKRDLFSDDEDGWIEDAALLDRLASEKLAGTFPALESEGWRWVQITTGYPGPTAERLRRIYAKPVQLTEDEEARREKLTEEWDELAALEAGGGLTPTNWKSGTRWNADDCLRFVDIEAEQKYTLTRNDRRHKGCDNAKGFLSAAVLRSHNGAYPRRSSSDLRDAFF